MAKIEWESDLEPDVFDKDKKVHWEKPSADSVISWAYRKSITLSRESGAVTNYQMKLLVGESAGATGENVDCGGKCNTDFSDLRFTAADETTLLDYYIESITGTTPNQLATIWIEFDSIGTEATTFYMYYGKDDADAASNGANTFILFEDFNGLTDGDLNGQNSWSGSVSFDIQGDVVAEGTKACKGVDAGGISVSKTFGGSIWNLYFQMRMRSSGILYTYQMGMEMYENTSKRGYVFIGEGFVKHYYLGNFGENVKAASSDVWYKIGYGITAKNAHKIWIDDELQSPAHSSNASTISSLVNKISLVRTSNDAGIFGFIDQILVTQFLDTGPAWGSWGDEEEGSFSLTA